MCRIITFFLLLINFSFVFGQEVVVGSGVCGSSSTQNTPIKYNDGSWNGGKNNSWTLMLFKGSEINTSGNITTIGFYPDCGNKTYPTVTNQRIYFKETTDSQVTNSSLPDITTFTKVFDGSITWKRKTPYSSARNDIILNAPFNYDKTKNLLVYFENESGVAVSSWSSIPFIWDNQGNNRVAYTLYKLSNKTTSVGYIDKLLPVTYFKFSNTPPTITLPTNTSICEGETFTFSGVSATNYTTLSWSTSGSGTFNNSTILNPTYTPNTNETGNITLTLQATGAGGTVSKNFILTIKPKPIANIIKH